jgi:hypothetical protein
MQLHIHKIYLANFFLSIAKGNTTNFRVPRIAYTRILGTLSALFLNARSELPRIWAQVALSS